MFLPEYPDYVKSIIARFESAGEEAFIVGGCLRDALLGKAPDDFDMATSALPERTMELFADKRLITNGLKHGTVTVVVDSHPVEITTFRIDGSYTDSRHPDEVRFTARIEEDLSRRDFTVNAMAYNESAGLVDPFGGREDLALKLLRAVGDPERRFDEDALRIMRAFRFSAQLGFDIEKGTLRGAGEKKDGLRSIARERIGVEFLKLVTSPDPTDALTKMKLLGVMPYVLGDYLPSDALIRLISKMPAVPSARLGLLLSETDGQSVRAVLRELKYSSKLVSSAAAVAEGARAEIRSGADAGRLALHFGDSAPYAALASELLGISPEGAHRLAEDRLTLPHSLGDLAIKGADVIALGASGKQIGEILNSLLEAVIDDPQKNKREILADLAKDLIINDRK